jgi:chloramphenicol O-acetyltransferase type A
MYEDQGRIKLGLGLQVHHGLVDGYHIGHFMHIVERHLNDPALIEDTFVSTFESA